ncbi:MAG: hypothetical protein AAGH92_04520 [Planctomycetota bacterium]
MSYDPEQLADLARRFACDRYLIRKKFFRLFGGAFHLYDDDGNVVLYAKQKRFRIREDMRLYADDSQDVEILRIGTTSIFDIAGTYAITDSLTDTTLGALRRKALKSIVRDEWLLLDEHGAEVGNILEDSPMAAIGRRILGDLSWLFPQKFEAQVGGQTVAHFVQRFNPFIEKIEITFVPGTDFDRRMGIAAAILLSAIEGKQ